MIFLFLQCVSTVIIVYIIISPLNSYLYIHWILDLLLNIITIVPDHQMYTQSDVSDVSDVYSSTEVSHDHVERTLTLLISFFTCYLYHRMKWFLLTALL